MANYLTSKWLQLSLDHSGFELWVRHLFPFVSAFFPLTSEDNQGCAVVIPHLVHMRVLTSRVSLVAFTGSLLTCD